MIRRADVTIVVSPIEVGVLRQIVPEERDVRLHGDTAVIAGIAHVLVQAGGNDIDVRLRFTEVYVKEGGAWKMLLWHSTRVP